LSILTIVITLVVVGFVLWLINYIPMQATIKKIVNVMVVIFVLVWLSKIFGLWAYLANIRI